ncbi:response regulator [Sphingomonas sp.]|uniref:response regulator transcription factor n=1 Tax=Sphingomonas sp. TaxID=28214 RepID=UPI001B2A12B2|nr:response regulator [Sphingomonas sp.]MBO9712384.1 response regulator transcription factor [Sphingomonas sp.]
MILCDAYVVEDDAAVRASLTTLLSLRGGLEVRSFTDGAAFLAAADVLPDGVLLLDQHLPGIGGIELLDALGERRARFPTILLTGDGDLGLAIRAMEAGVREFIEKPHDSRVLLQAVDEACDDIHGDAGAAGRQAEIRARIARLSLRERQVLRALARGQSTRAIADELGISPRACEADRAGAIEKLGARNLAQAVMIAHSAGLLAAD